MKVWTVHLRDGSKPELVREGWSWGAFLFQGLWLLATRAWIPGIVWIAVELGLALLLPREIMTIVAAALAVLAGFVGRDLVRWQLYRRGYVLGHVVAERNGDAAWARLLARRPDLAARFA